MSDKIQLIKEEIKRRISNLEQIGDRKEIEIHFSEQFRFIKMYEGLIKFIDSLDSIPEEHTSEDRINECLNWDKDWGCSISPMKQCDTCPYAKWVEVKEEREKFVKSVSEDLDEEIGKYTTNHLLKKRNHSTGVYHLTQKDCDDIARHFAEWQKHKDQEINELTESSDLDEASWKYSDRDGITYGKRYAMQIDFKAGARWQKQQMMKDAVKCEVYYTHMFDENGKPFTDVKFIRRNDNTDYGTKAKIIIVKEEQQ